MTEPLEFSPGDERWHAFRQRGLTDLYFFASVILGYGPRVPITEPAHKLFCKVLERRTGIPEIDGAWVIKIEQPRGAGKTTIGSQAYVLQRLCQEPNISILLVNEKLQTAQDILSEIKQQLLTNELLRTLYPEILPDDMRETTWSATRIVIKRTESRKDPSVFVIGVGGTVIGAHPDEILVDDMLSREAMESARAGSLADVMGQLNRWIHQLVPLLSNHPRRRLGFIGTRWWYGDSYEHIEESFGYGQPPVKYLLKTKLSDGTVQRLPVYRVGDLVVFRRAAIEDGQPAFISLGEHRFGLDALAKFRMQDPELFAANMMNQPTDELTATFKEPWLRFYDWMDDEHVAFNDPGGKRRVVSVRSLDVVLLVDPGGFGTRGTERARPAFWVVGSLVKEGLHLLLHCWSERATYVACQQEIVTAVARYNARKAYVELAGQQLPFIDGLRALCLAQGSGVIVQELRPRADQAKDDRILGLEGYFQRGQIYVGRGATFHEFRTQYAQFPRSARKDLLDALAWGPHVWPKASGGAVAAQQRQQAEVQAYYARRRVG